MARDILITRTNTQPRESTIGNGLAVDVVAIRRVSIFGRTKWEQSLPNGMSIEVLSLDQRAFLEGITPLRPYVGYNERSSRGTYRLASVNSTGQQISQEPRTALQEVLRRQDVIETVRRVAREDAKG